MALAACAPCRIGISPDSFEPWPVTLRAMLEYSFAPGSEAFVAQLIDKGGLGVGTL